MRTLFVVLGITLPGAAAPAFSTMHLRAPVAVGTTAGYSAARPLEPASTDSRTSVGAIEGFARSEGTSVPIAFALVRLYPHSGPAIRHTITSAEGRFFFGEIPDGDYSVELLRIGYSPVRSNTLRIQSGRTIRQDIVGPMRPVDVPALAVYPPGTCWRGDELEKDARQSALWAEAQRGVEIRRAFDLRYRYGVQRAQKYDIKIPNREVIRQERTDTLDSEPDSVAARDERRIANGAKEGYGRGNTVVLPDEKEILDDRFLTNHCIETPMAVEGGMLGLRFRPINARGKGHAIAGTIWVDSASYLIRRLDLQYLDGAHLKSEASVEYADVDVHGSKLRLPSRGAATVLAPSRAPKGSRVDGTLTYSYSRFARVDPK